MKFEDAVRHLKGLGLAAVMPNGKLHPEACASLAVQFPSESSKRVLCLNDSVR
jgi:hypothetical protein